MVTPASSSVAEMRSEIRNYVGISSTSLLPDSTIDQELNYVYTANVPESIKLDQLKTVYTIYTLPFCDRYPVDINKYQSFREPVLIDGLRATFYKDRGLFYGYWPPVRTYLQPAQGDGTTTSFTFTINPVPIVRTTFVCSVKDTSGFQLICSDAANVQSNEGTLLQVFRESDGDYNPAFPATSPLPVNPLPNPPFNNQVGTVNYETGSVSINWPTPPASGESLRVQFYGPTTGRPIGVLFWNNEFIIRPVPKHTHKIEIEAYQTPIEFMQTTDTPFLLNFKDYLTLGTSIQLLSRMGDYERKMQLMPDFDAAEGRILERQANEEIGQANSTIFNQQSPGYPQYPYGGLWF